MGAGIAVLVPSLFKEGSGAPPAWGSRSKATEDAAVHTCTPPDPALRPRAWGGLSGGAPFPASLPHPSDGGDPQISKGPRLTPTLSCASTLPVWFENWTEFTASISNPNTCKTEREGPGVRACQVAAAHSRCPTPARRPAWRRGAAGRACAGPLARGPGGPGSACTATLMASDGLCSLLCVENALGSHQPEAPRLRRLCHFRKSLHQSTPEARSPCPVRRPGQGSRRLTAPSARGPSPSRRESGEAGACMPLTARVFVRPWPLCEFPELHTQEYYLSLPNYFKASVIRA